MNKDYNDLLRQEYNIADLKTVPLDIAALEIELDELHDKQSEYKKAANYCKTVKDTLIKSDIAELLTKRWNKPLDEVKRYLNIDTETADELVAVADDTDSAFRKFKEYMESGSTNLGFKSIDESLGGIKNTDVIGLGGYSNHGKSFFMIKIAAYRLVREKNNVLIFSQEMPTGQVMQYLLQELFHMSERRFYEFVQTDDGADVYSKVKDTLSNRIRIIDETGKTMDDVWKITEAFNNNDFHVDFVIFDNFQLIPNTSQFEKYEEQAKKMKAFTNHFHTPLLMLTQLNDGFQQRGAKKIKPPCPADIKGSNAFMSACDEVILIWRPALMQSGTDSITAEENKNITMVKIGKVRREIHGPTMFKYEYDYSTYSLKEVPM